MAGLERWFAERRVVLAVAVVVLVCGLSAESGASEADKNVTVDVLRLDGTTYDRDDIIEDFLNVSVARTLWDKAGTPKCPKHGIVAPPREDANVIYERTVWWDAFFHPEATWPNSCVLNKWTHDVAVGINWPHNQISAWAQSKNADTLELQYPVIETQIKKIIPEISTATGINVTFVERNDPRERSPEFAQIRIVPVYGLGIKNLFKSENLYTDTSQPAKLYYEWLLEHHECLFFGAVPFTPDMRSQVDGYLLPNADNTMGLSVCKISILAGAALMEALITECVMRAMGLPNVLHNHSEAVLGNWNAVSDEYSLLPSLDGKKARWSEGETYVSPLPGVAEHAKQYTIPKDYDLLMLKLLYCPKLSSGMDKSDIRKVLKDDESCFN